MALGRLPIGWLHVSPSATDPNASRVPSARQMATVDFMSIPPPTVLPHLGMGVRPAVNAKFPLQGKCFLQIASSLLGRRRAGQGDPRGRTVCLPAAAQDRGEFRVALSGRPHPPLAPQGQGRPAAGPVARRLVVLSHLSDELGTSSTRA